MIFFPRNDGSIIFEYAVKMLCPTPIHQDIQSCNTRLAHGDTNLDALVVERALERAANFERDME